MKICLLCDNAISEWSIATGRTTVVNGQIVHNSCLAQQTIASLKEKQK